MPAVSAPAPCCARMQAGRSGLRPNDFEPASALATWIGRVDAVDATPLPAAFAAYDCRNNRLAQLALEQDGFVGAVARGSAAPWRRPRRRVPGHDHLGNPRHRTRVPRDRAHARTRWRRAVPRTVSLPPQPVCDDRIRACLSRLARPRGDGVDGLLVERQGVRGRRAGDRRRGLRRRRRRRRGFARVVHAVRLPFARIAVAAVRAGRAPSIATASPSARRRASRCSTRAGRPSQCCWWAAARAATRYHMSSPHPEGAGAARAMRAALRTRLSRPTSTTSICTARRAGRTTPRKTARCSRCSAPPRRSVRPRAGRATRLGAAGIIGALIAELALRRSGCRDTQNCERVDPALACAVALRSHPRACGVSCAMRSASAAPIAASCWGVAP